MHCEDPTFLLITGAVNSLHITQSQTRFELCRQYILRLENFAALALIVLDILFLQMGPGLAAQFWFDAISSGRNFNGASHFFLLGILLATGTPMNTNFMKMIWWVIGSA